MNALRGAAYVASRSGLGDLPARLRAGSCTIAYMGASVTAQKDGYRPRLHELLCRRTGNAHRAVNGALGATGSITGLFLMDELVLPRRPDLAFVEYATSDVAGTTPAEYLDEALDGIVAKLRDAGCEPCLLYLYRADQDLAVGNAVTDVHERVAERHGVASIDVAAWLRDRVARGEIDAGSLLRDVVHTTARGSDLVAAAILEGLDDIPAGPPRPLRAESAPRTALVAVGPELLRAPTPDREGRFRLAWRYLVLEPGEELRFRPEGDLIGLLVVLGPSSGYIELETDAASREFLLWDEECSYERLGSLILSPCAPAGGEVTIRVGERTVDHSRARRPLDPAETAHKRLKLVALMERR